MAWAFCSFYKMLRLLSSPGGGQAALIKALWCLELPRMGFKDTGDATATCGAFSVRKAAENQAGRRKGSTCVTKTAI